MIESFKIGLQQLGKAAGAAVRQDRTDLDLSLKIAGGIALVILLVLTLVPGILGYIDSVWTRAIAALMVAIFAFFFVTVSSRIVGLVGVTSNPTSGMTIATLIVTSLVFLLFGWTDDLGKASALMVGTVVCIAASIAGDTSQDLKTGFILGATPKRQQIGELVGVLTSAGVVCFVLILLDESLTLGSSELPAPQATLMKLVIDGVLEQQLPWNLVAIGAALAFVVWLFRVPPLPFAVGVYLPLSTMAPVFLGGLLRYVLTRKQKEEEKERRREKGVLLGSGMVGGEGLTGVLFALWIVLQGGGKIAGVGLSYPTWAAIVIALFGLLAFLDAFRMFILSKEDNGKKPNWYRPVILLVIAIGLALAFGTLKKESPAKQVSSVTVIHMNDVYEMMPSGNDTGGLARVASLRQQLIESDGNVLTVLAGDMVSPSAIGLAKINGERLAGKQMIACMNALGLDVMAFGNHEFDIGKEAILARVGESEFTWVNANIYEADTTELFADAAPYIVKTFEQGQKPLRVGIFSVCLDANKEDYLRYDTDYNGVSAKITETLRNEEKVDIVIALTHLTIEQDKALAAAVPDIDIVMGGHEHENMNIPSGSDNTPVTKADANAKSVYVHRLSLDHATGEVSMKSELRPIDASLPDEPNTAAVAKKWKDLAYASYIADGIEPDAVVTTPTDDLDGLEMHVRNKSTKLTELIGAGLRHDFEDSDASVYNSGSIRIDDMLKADQTIRQYDLLRILPFGGDTRLVSMKGDVLVAMLNQGVKNQGSGGFLQMDGIDGNTDAWLLNNEPIDPAKSYKIVLTDFLLTGAETGLSFITPDNPGIEELAQGSDVRKALGNELVKVYGAPQ